MVLFLKMLGELANSHPPQKPEYIQSNLKTNINEIKKISKNFFELNTQFQTAKEKYFNDCKIAEDTITEFEQTKESLEPSEQSVQEENMEKKLQIAKDSETNYIKLMESVNSEKDKFYEQGSSLFKIAFWKGSSALSIQFAFSSCSFKLSSSTRTPMEESSKAISNTG